MAEGHKNIQQEIKQYKVSRTTDNGGAFSVYQIPNIHSIIAVEILSNDYFLQCSKVTANLGSVWGYVIDYQGNRKPSVTVDVVITYL